MKISSRKEKEKLYVDSMIELQSRWGNPTDSEWDFSDWTDTELDKGLDDVVEQLKFEKNKKYFKFILIIILVAFTVLIFSKMTR